ncbi:beta-lactamase family protein [bacterium]|nr:beta-lactamase family protein [bacterium]
MRLGIIVLLIAVSYRPLPARTAGEDLSTNVKLQRFEEAVAEIIAAWNLPGAAVAVVYHDEIVHMRGYGVRMVYSPVPIDEHTVFRIASLSKGFAAVLSGLLVRDGWFDWDDPVKQYLPFFELASPEYTRTVTIGNVLSQSTGLMHHAYTNLIEDGVPYQRILTELKDVPITGEPGVSYGYQNVVFALIGDIIAGTTGTSFEEMLRQRIFEPLHMTESSIGWDALMQEENRAYPHIRRHGEWIPVNDKKAFYSVPPSAGVNASLHDMVIWLRAQMGQASEIIPEDVLQTVQAPRVRSPREHERMQWPELRDTYYGYGWRMYDYAGYTMIYHSGGLQGYMSQLAFIPEEGLGIVVLMNSRRTDEIVPALFDIFLDLDHERGECAWQ